jgi:NADH:ubiquinone oxidoreductase subunit C
MPALNNTSQQNGQERTMPPALDETELHARLLKAAGLPPEWTKDNFGNHYAWLHLSSPDSLVKVAETLTGKARLCAISPYAEMREDEHKRRALAYHFITGTTLLTVTVPVYNPQTLEKIPVPSITPWFGNADWSERDFHERFDIDIQGHPDLPRLFLDERLDAGLMNQLIPFSALANSAGTQNLWELVMAAKTSEAPESVNPAATASVDKEPA